MTEIRRPLPRGRLGSELAFWEELPAEDRIAPCHLGEKGPQGQWFWNVGLMLSRQSAETAFGTMLALTTTAPKRCPYAVPSNWGSAIPKWRPCLHSSANTEDNSCVEHSLPPLKEKRDPRPLMVRYGLTPPLDFADETDLKLVSCLSQIVSQLEAVPA